MRLTQKMLKEKTKLGWTKSDFAEYLGSTEEEFLSVLRKIYTSTIEIDRILHELKKNEKIRKRTSKTTATTSVVKKTEHKGELKASLNDVESLKEEQKNLIELSKELEGKYDSLSNLKGDYMLKLTSERGELERIGEQLQRKKEYCQYLLKKLDDFEQNMAKISNEFQQVQEQISNIGQRIENLIVVEVFAYSDGQIEVIDGLISVGEQDENIYNELVSNPLPEFETLTLKQIRQVSKIVTMVRLLKSNARKYNISFESHQVEKAFSSLKSKI